MIRVVLCDPQTIRQVAIEGMIKKRDDTLLIYSSQIYDEIYDLIKVIQFDILLVLFDNAFYENFPLKKEIESIDFKIIYVIPNEFSSLIELSTALSENSHFAKPNCDFEDLYEQMKQLTYKSQ